MKTIFFFLLVFLFVNVSAQKLEKLWETKQVLNVPESVLYSDSVLYVSNISGGSDEINGQGFISKLTLNGEIIQLKWASGLDAPKGMGIYNGKLYVSDVTKVVAFNVEDGQMDKTIEIPGSEFLNDISISSEGIVAVSDMKKQTIHYIKDNELINSYTNEKLNYVNGLFWDGNVLLAGTGGVVYKIIANSDNPEAYITETGGIDGLEKVGENKYVISDWSGKIQLISPDTKPVVLLNTTDAKINAADIGCDANAKIIYIPTFMHNTVAAYKLVE